MKKKFLFLLPLFLLTPFLASCGPTATPKNLLSIKVSDDAKTQYMYGDEFVKPDVFATYTDQSIQKVNAIFSDYDMHKTGDQFVNVSYRENGTSATTYYKITVSPLPLVLDSIGLSGEIKTVYTVDDNFVKPKVMAYYTNQSFKEVEATFTGYDLSTSGVQTVTVSYSENDVTKSLTYKIQVNEKPEPEKTLVSISLADNKKTEYKVGDYFVAPKVTATYSDESSKEVYATFSGYDMNIANTYEVTATYTEKDVTKTATYEIVVKRNEDPEDPLDVKDIDPMLVSSQEYFKFFNHTTKLEIHIDVSKAAAEFMNQYQTGRYGSTYYDYYVPCNVDIYMDGTQYAFEDVGIRVKGNTSRQQFLENGHFTTNRLAHFKLKFCETFDGEEYDDIPELRQFKKTYPSKDDKKVIKNRRLFDMEKINIKWNRNDDKTISRQGYILKSFENNGVLAGKSTLSMTSLDVTGTDPINVVYEVLEDIDDVFISRHFAEEYAAGDLYKCCYQNAPANFSKYYTVGNQIGVEDNVTGYHPAYDLKTNKKKSDHSALLSLIQSLNKDNLTAEQFKEEMSSKMHMESFLKYEAVAFLGGNFDDLRNNANNYYLYFVSGSNYCYIIPYDFDRCFGCGTNGYKDFMTSFSADSTKMQCTGDWQNMSLYWRTVCRPTDGRPNRVNEYYNIYCESISNLINNNIVGPSSFVNFVNEYPNSYGCNAYGSGNGNITFADYFQRKIQAIKQNNPEIIINK